ncbi:hypothetical protein FS782_13780 [Agrobacterium vitis]|uniref:hypothetical protein n=1 Tax=Agrobacterium vitis TaxID=373 RepID=UPI001F1BFE5B|nr:hypothetical protein [Agrobacterium vitis]MCF1478141.1 hypothetical protein [Agrobacterium vitis]
MATHNARDLRRRTTISLKPQAMFFDYATVGLKAEVLTAGWFNTSRDNLTPGSIIDAVVDWASTKEYVRIKVATVPATGNVTVTDVTGDTTAD